MTYSAGNTIIDDDYNIFATGNASGSGDNNVANINTVWGSGTGEKGYGQSSTLSAVSAGNTVQATNWANLIARNTSLAKLLLRNQVQVTQSKHTLHLAQI